MFFFTFMGHAHMTIQWSTLQAYSLKLIFLGSVAHSPSGINHEGAHRQPPTVLIHELPLMVHEARHPPVLWVRAPPNKGTHWVTPTIPLVVVVVVVVA